jgi:hypothetical protein
MGCEPVGARWIDRNRAPSPSTWANIRFRHSADGRCIVRPSAIQPAIR